MAPALLRSSRVSNSGTTRCTSARGCAWLRLLVLSAADCSVVCWYQHRLTKRRTSGDECLKLDTSETGTLCSFKHRSGLQDYPMR